MLEQIRRGQRWVTALFVVGIGVVFVFFIGLGGPLRGGSPNAIMRVGPYEIDVREFQRMRAQQEERLRAALGEEADLAKFRETIEGFAVRALMDRAVLALEAEALGLTVAKEEVERQILLDPGFRQDGRFDREAFRNWVSWEFGNERIFREQQRRAALAAKLLQLIEAEAQVSEGEAREAARRSLEAVQIAFPVLDTTRLPADFEPEPEALAALLTEREADLRARYDERLAEYDVPERTRARHILLQVEPDADEPARAATALRAEALRERLRAGEDFATLAEELSDDPGSSARGGDLGYFRRGQMVPAFDQVAFALEPGELSEVVRTEYGYHLIRVEDRQPAQRRSFEDVREELARELLGESAARESAWATAEQLAEAVRSGTPLEDAARAAELTLERPDWLQRRADGFVPGLGAAPDLLAVAFTLEPGQSSPRIFESGDKLALVQLLERREADPGLLEARVDELRERLAAEKLERRAEAWIGARRQALQKDGELAVHLDRL